MSENEKAPSRSETLQALAAEHGTDKVLALLAPAVFDTRKQACDHNDFWFADSGLCWCRGCGRPFNGVHDQLESSLPRNHRYFEVRRARFAAEERRYAKGYWSGGRWYPSYG